MLNMRVLGLYIKFFIIRIFKTIFKYKLLIALLFFAFVIFTDYIFLVLYEKPSIPLQLYDPKYLEKVEELDKFKYILLWTPYFRKKLWNHPTSVRDKSYFEGINCPVTDCIIAAKDGYDKHYSDFDALIFHTPTLKKRSVLPAIRNQKQLYIFASDESACYWKAVRHLEDGYFNTTLHYRLESDALWLYFGIADKDTDHRIAPSMNVKWKKPDKNFFNKNLYEFVKQKKKSMVVAISHCGAPSGRDDLVRDISRYFPVDIYGRCGNLSSTDHGKTMKIMGQTYYFYGSFENSIYRQYVTEKIIRPLMRRRLIPVAYGGANYSHFVPPHTYIDANDFENPKKLTEYLKFLSQHPREYIKYFWWARYYKVTKPNLFCNACMEVHRRKQPGRFAYYKNMARWWKSNLTLSNLAKRYNTYSKNF